MEENRQVKQTHIFKWIFGIVILLAIAATAYELKFFDLVIGIVKLEGDKGSKVKKISFKTQSFITHSGNEEYFIDEMARRGWEYIARYGRGMIFAKDGIEILMTKYTYLGKYDFYEGQIEI